MERKCTYCDRAESDGYELRKSRKTGEVLCSKHRTQIKRHGKVFDRTRFDANEFVICNEYAEMILYDRYGKENGRTLIDISDIEMIRKHKWNLKKKSEKSVYVRTTIGKSDIELQQFLMSANNNDIIIVDHKNRNTLDNRRKNLRLATSSQNGMNKSIQSNNTSGVVGVHYDKKKNKWVSRIKKDKITISLGSFDNIEDAIVSRLNAEVYYFGEFAPQTHLFGKYGIEVEEE